MPRIKQSKKCKAICLSLMEEKNKKGLDYLKKWARAKEVKIKNVVVYVYYDSPLFFPPEKCRRDICIIFDEHATEDRKVKIKRFPEQRIAYLSFNGGMQKACAEFFKWLEKNEYRKTTPLREIHWGKRKELQIGIKDTLN